MNNRIKENLDFREKQDHIVPKWLLFIIGIVAFLLLINKIIFKFSLIDGIIAFIFIVCVEESIKREGYGEGYFDGYQDSKNDKR